MPALKRDTTEAAITQTLALVDRHSPPTSPAHRVNRVGSDRSDEPVSRRSSYYVPSPHREAIPMDFEDSKSPKDYDDAKSTVSSKSKRSQRLLAKLRPSKTRTTSPQQEVPHGKTDRLCRFVNFKGIFGGPETSLAGDPKRAAEENMLRESNLAYMWWM